MMTKIETAILYGEYKALCSDRGVFPKAHKEFSHFEEVQWLTYIIELIKALPSQTERQAP